MGRKWLNRVSVKKRVRVGSGQKMHAIKERKTMVNRSPETGMSRSHFTSTAVVCNTCGLPAIYEISIDSYICPRCMSMWKKR